jgi:hypothetical protein
MVLMALLLGATCPFFIATIPTTITKWLLFVVALKRHPSILRLILVATAEMFCVIAVIISLRELDAHRFEAAAGYLLSATFPNLLLLPSANQRWGSRLLKKCLYAFLLGSIYLLWAPFVGLGLWEIIGR